MGPFKDIGKLGSGPIARAIDTEQVRIGIYSAPFGGISGFLQRLVGLANFAGAGVDEQGQHDRGVLAGQLNADPGGAVAGPVRAGRALPRPGAAMSRRRRSSPSSVPGATLMVPGHR